MPRVRGKTSSAAAGVARREGGACARVLQRVSACGGRPVTFTLRTSESGCFVTQGLHSTAIFRFERLVRLRATVVSPRVRVCHLTVVSARASLYFKVKGVLLLIIVRYPGTPHAGPRPAPSPRGPRPRRGAPGARPDPTSRGAAETTRPRSAVRVRRPPCRAPPPATALRSSRDARSLSPRESGRDVHILCRGSPRAHATQAGYIRYALSRSAQCTSAPRARGTRAYRDPGPRATGVPRSDRHDLVRKDGMPAS